MLLDIHSRISTSRLHTLYSVFQTTNSNTQHRFSFLPTKKKSNNVHVSPGKAEWGRRNSSGGGGKAGKQTFSTLHGKQKIASAATSDRPGKAYSFSFVRLQ